MDKFTALEPVRLHGTGVKKSPGVYRSFIGPLPEDIHLLVLQSVPVPSLPHYACASRALHRLVNHEDLWKQKYRVLGLDEPPIASLLTSLEREMGLNGVDQNPPVLNISTEEDDFGDFASASIATFQIPQPQKSSNDTFGQSITLSASTVHRTSYIKAHTVLLWLAQRLSAAPHQLLSELFPPPSPPLRQQSMTLRLLSRFLSPILQPTTSWQELRSGLASAIDRFQANMLAKFELADSRGDEMAMMHAAWASWECWEPTHFGGEWELGRVWAEKLEIFYEGSDWNPLGNFTPDGNLAFEAMDGFMNHTMDAVRRYGSLAVRIFPPESGVLLAFSDKLANEIVGEYITALLSKARGLESRELFLQAVAASFVQSWRMVTVLGTVSLSPPLNTENSTPIDDPTASTSLPALTQIQAEDVVFRMFETHMDEYLDEEIEYVKVALAAICADWDVKSTNSSSSSVSPDAHAPRFLGSQNPAYVKRTVLASFTDLMLLPVTIVPRTVGAVGQIVHSGGTAAVNGIAMLNPARWGGVAPRENDSLSSEDSRRTLSIAPSTRIIGHDDPSVEPVQSVDNNHNGIIKSGELSSTGNPTKSKQFDSLQLLLSLDIALEIIHADRESLKRVKTFREYPGQFGHRVRDTIEELFILMLQSLSEGHIVPGFTRATQEMRAYNPAEYEESDRVAPLMHFFELVHVGDMMQSMVQVYFDKELAAQIDKTDFLNGVVREKKRFENSLDECVAAGLNAGTEVLMAQVEHIIQTKTAPREYYPVDNATTDLQPSLGCREAITCLNTHCSLLKGSTSKEVLEVFHQEIGIRLHAIVEKHLKRQIISLEGGFKVIADLNAYHTFIATLRVPLILSDFANLKMLGHVFIVEDANDLVQIVRDVRRYGNSFRPEDIYEFLQRRSDWKKIEKTVDKAMYNLSFREDCVIC